MAISNGITGVATIVNANPDAVLDTTGFADLDASKLVITLAENLKPLPNPETLVFGQTKTDHMLTVEFDPAKGGWCTPHIRPYAPLELDPMASCFQYCPNIFEGMKAYIGPDGEPRLFRPSLNMARMANSAERVALPPFNTAALLELIKALVRVEKRWIPAGEGYSLYIRPTLIGTRDALGVTASDKALLYAVLTPVGPYFRKSAGGGGMKGISLLAVSETVRSWPGGTGAYKLGLNYAPGFKPQQEALKKGYQQILWLLEENGSPRITEVGAMNVFCVVKSETDENAVELVTPPLDGTILPGLTRASVLELARAHSSYSSSSSSSASSSSTPAASPLPLPKSLKITTAERPVFMTDIVAWARSGRLLEVFGVGTAVVVAPVGKIGFEGVDYDLPHHEGGLGLVGKAMNETIQGIQTGVVDWQGWCVKV